MTALMQVQVELLRNPDGRIKCSHEQCDGRSAKWTYPQTSDLPDGSLNSCNVHAGRFLEIVLELLGGVVPRSYGRKRHRA